MKIVVDADACPVWRIAAREGRRRHIPVVMVSDTAHRLEGEFLHVVVDQGRESADCRIANLLQSGDLAITQDYGVAALALARGARALRQDGLEYTADRMDQLLMERHLAGKIRRAGGRPGRHRPFTVREEECFCRALVQLLEPYAPRFAEAQPQDGPQISRLMADSWRAAYAGMLPEGFLERMPDDRWCGMLAQELPRADYLGLMLYENTTLAGIALLMPSREEGWRGWGEVQALYLAPAYWGRGYGSLLLRESLARLQQRGCPRSYLWALRENARAWRFYEREGWQNSGETLTVLLEGSPLVDYRYLSPAE